MPVTQKRDSFGPYYQYGNHGYKYRYPSTNLTLKLVAKNKALLQQKAAHAHR
jgi:hypothetical protein